MNIQEVIEHMGPEPVCASIILRGMGIDPDRWIRKYLSKTLEEAETSRQYGIHSVPDDDGRRLWVHDPTRAYKPYKPEPTPRVDQPVSRPIAPPPPTLERAQMIGAYDYCECGKMAYATQQDAEDGMRRIALGGANRKGKPIRVYQCRSGDWHITSKPYRPNPRPESVR